MKIFIDQSGKVEYTSHPTIVAYSNGYQKSIYISTKDKQEILHVFREVEKPDMFTFRTFGILMAILVEKDINKITSIIIDIEYPGNEDLIKDTFLQSLRKKGITFDRSLIHFAQIGKKHQCHKTAIEVFRGNKKPDIAVSAKKVLEFIV